MGFLTDLLSHAFDALLWGVLIAIGITVGLFFLARGFYRRASVPVLGVVVSILLFFLLASQTCLLIGAMKIKGMADDVLDASRYMYQIDLAPGADASALEDEYKRLTMRDVKEDFPWIDSFVDVSEVAKGSAYGLVETIHDSVSDSLVNFIFMRVLYAVLFIVVGFGLLLWCISRSSSTGTSSSASSSDYSEYCSSGDIDVDY